jgi:hypothetical protein
MVAAGMVARRGGAGIVTRRGAAGMEARRPMVVGDVWAA